MSDERFAFGENWRRFIDCSTRSGSPTPSGRCCDGSAPAGCRGSTFLDAGCGSGLFSLAAHRLGAAGPLVRLRPGLGGGYRRAAQRFAPDSDWTVETRLTVLDPAYLAGLGRTTSCTRGACCTTPADMWRPSERSTDLVAPGGRLFISIYNDQGLASRYWRRVKRRYVRSGRVACGRCYGRPEPAVLRRLTGRCAG